MESVASMWSIFALFVIIVTSSYHVYYTIQAGSEKGGGDHYTWSVLGCLFVFNEHFSYTISVCTMIRTGS